VSNVVPGRRAEAFFETLLQDIRYALRMLHRYPTFALSAIVTLGFGIGVNTAVFSVVNAIVLRPLPVRDGDRLVVIASQRTPNRTLRGVSFADLQDYRRHRRRPSDIAGYSVGLGLVNRRRTQRPGHGLQQLFSVVRHPPDFDA
jgi:hypothetical protein